MNQLALGTVQFGLDYGISNSHGQVIANEVKQILTIANEHNIDTLDTAVAYGESEKVLGNNIVDKTFNIITKISVQGCSYQQICRKLNISLKYLKQKKLHAILLHNAAELLSKDAIANYKNLLKLKNRFCNKIGVSVYTPKELMQIIEQFDIDIVQIPLNVFDQRFLDQALVNKLKAKKIEIHARSVFLQGLLLMNFSQLPYFFTQELDIFKLFMRFNQQHQFTQLMSCLTFAKANSFVDKFVIGCCSAEQLLEIINTFKNAPTIDIKEFQLFSSKNATLITPSLWPSNIK